MPMGIDPDDYPSRSELAKEAWDNLHLDFRVYGRPQPAGSKRGFPIKANGRYTGRVAVVDDNPRAKSWQGMVATAGAEAFMAWCGPARGADFDPCPELLDGPLGLSLVFTLARPKGHHGTGRNAGIVKRGAPAWPCVKPDTTKLIRAVEDALTGVLWRDDAQVVEQYAAKHYGSPEGVRVRLWRL